MRSDPGSWWARSADGLLTELGTQESGLSLAEARRRLAKAGPNRIAEREGFGAARLLLRQFQSPLILILIFAAVVSLLVREWTEAAIILVIVFGSTVLGFSQEYQASVALNSLRQRLALKVTVLRGGAERSVPVEKVVVGDIILLSAGNMVPADGVVIEARDFLVSQAALTGESFPVEKRIAPTPADAALSERTNAVFMGTSVRSGTAKMLVVVTGASTAIGTIAGRIAGPDPETDFERGLRKFGYLLTQVMIVMVTLVLVANIVLGRPLIDSLLFSVALAVGLTPELLPAIASITMAAGARRMAKGGVIVRRTSAIENLGSVDVLCTDKTGTLTRGVVELSGATDADGIASDEVFRLALINAGLETGIKNPLDEAIVNTAKARGESLPTLTKIDEIPYDFLRKRLTIVVDIEAESDHLIVTKGAFDTVLSCCGTIALGAGEQPLDAVGRAKLAAFCAAKGAEGFRVLGVATRRLPPKPRYDPADEAEMVFRGFLLFFDPLKEGVAETLRKMALLGVGVKIITGDNRYVAAHVGQAVGLGGTLLTGDVLNRTRDEALWHLAENTDIFAEIDPQQKERIVAALQARGHSVAYLGDGINDAPALQLADVGISVDQAVDVARESADIVLCDRDLGVLVQGIVDGRRTFANTLKYISITTSANFGNMISMAIGTLFLPFLPLLASQILLNNFLSDFPSIAISSDDVDPETVAKSPRWDIGQIRFFMIVFGLISTVFDLLTFGLLILVFDAGESLFQSTWFVISLLTELAVVLVLRTRRPFWQSRPSQILVWSTLVVAAAAIGLPYVAVLAGWVGLAPLPPHLLFSGLGVVALYIATTEATKHVFYTRAKG
ncbi:MAG: magnesium-translocating P-type ATPase [Paracoccaceae bacterium]